MKTVKAYHIFVYGRVQGVGFRYWVLSAARRFRISGWVRNTENYHCVEILAESENEDNLKEFIQAVKTEHPYAKVDASEISEIAPSGYKGFSVVR